MVLKKLLSSVARDLWVVLLDLVAVNLSYYLALLIRFFVGGELRAVAENRYMPAFLGFAPFYTVLCLLVFMAWRLYGGMWRYAGINDMNRIIGASACTAILHLLGTAIFFTRMPWTYYLIGAVLQFGFVVCIRFGYRVLLVEKKRIGAREKIPAMVVGSREFAQKVIKHLEENTPYRAAFILSTSRAGRSLDGIPMVSFEELEQTIPKVKIIFIANKGLTEADREKIREAAGEREVVDFTGALTNIAGSVPLAALLPLVSGSITLTIDGEKTRYESGAAALEAVKDRMDVKGIKGEIEIELRKSRVIDNSWIENYTAATGEDFVMRGF